MSKSELLKAIKDEYFISDKSTSLRIDWCINDYNATHKLTTAEKGYIFNATDDEIKNA